MSDHSVSNMDVAVSEFAFTCIAPKRCKHDPNIKGGDYKDHGPSRQWTNFGIAQAFG